MRANLTGRLPSSFDSFEAFDESDTRVVPVFDVFRFTILSGNFLFVSFSYTAVYCVCIGIYEKCVMIPPV